MRITADTEAELDEALEAHLKPGQAIPAKVQDRDGAWFAMLEETAPSVEAVLYRCKLCQMVTANKKEICDDRYDLTYCYHAIASMGVDVVKK